MENTTDRAVQLLVVGAGPVGLTAALSAARRGLNVEVIEQSFRGWGRGYAALLHPSSLRIFRELGIADSLVEAGHPIRGVTIHANGALPFRVVLREPALAIAQARIEETLLGALRRLGVELRAPFQAGTIQQELAKVHVRVVRRELADLGSPADFSEWRALESSMVEADFVIGADGYDSRVRTALGIEAANVDRTEAFAMFEVGVKADLGHDIHLAFAEGLGSVIVPLPNARARFGFQLHSELAEEPSAAQLAALLAERFPWFREALDEVDWSSVVHFERRLARRFGFGRVWLAGDAAHVTSPFGAHSMNGGLSEAYDLVERIAECTSGRAGIDSLERYGFGCERAWRKLLGFHVKYELLPNAPEWLGAYARRLAPSLPVSGVDLPDTLRAFGLAIA
jgi:2-polyprenyl-6-methoxyphenol hydroxylase-like FAD-dependent oxidoreductase